MQKGVPPAVAETTGTSRKQFMLLEGAPILVHTVRKFVASPLVTDIVVAVREEEIEWVEDMLKKEGRGLLGGLRIVAGGNSRQESVENAFASLDSDTDIVARSTMPSGPSSIWTRSAASSRKPKPAAPRLSASFRWTPSSR